MLNTSLCPLDLHSFIHRFGLAVFSTRVREQQKRKKVERAKRVQTCSTRIDPAHIVSMARHAMDDLFGTPQIDYDHHASGPHFGEERLDDIMPSSAVRRTSSAEGPFGRSEVTTPVKYDIKTLDEMLKHDQADLDDAVENLFSPASKKYSTTRQSYATQHRTEEEATHRDLLADVDDRERQTFSPIDGASFSHSPPRPAANHRPQHQRPQRESSQGRMSLKEQEKVSNKLLWDVNVRDADGGG